MSVKKIVRKKQPALKGNFHRQQISLAHIFLTSDEHIEMLLSTKMVNRFAILIQVNCTLDSKT